MLLGIPAVVTIDAALENAALAAAEPNTGVEYTPDGIADPGNAGTAIGEVDTQNDI